jgi:spermidine synthase
MRIGEDGGRAALLVNGVVQSISPDDGLADGGYWAAMVPNERPRQALVLGLGGGTLVALLHARWGTFPIVGVDHDQNILEAAQQVGWLPRDELDVVVADAFEFVQTCQTRFDYIAIDLYTGEQMVGRTCGKPFLRRVRSLLQPRGGLAINLFSDVRLPLRLARIGALFDIRDQVGVGGNVVVHARRRT